MQEIQKDVLQSSNVSGNQVIKNIKNNKTPNDFLSNDYTDQYDDDGEDGEEGGYEGENVATGNAGRNSLRPKRIHILKRVGTTYAWGRWEKWSRCTNSCVQIRKRQCIKR